MLQKSFIYRIHRDPSFLNQNHYGPVSSLKLTKDETHLFTASTDGSFSIFETKDKERLREARDRQSKDEILTNKQELEELKNKINTNKTSIDEEMKSSDNLDKENEIKEQDNYIYLKRAECHSVFLFSYLNNLIRKQINQEKK